MMVGLPALFRESLEAMIRASKFNLYECHLASAHLIAVEHIQVAKQGKLMKKQVLLSL